MNVLHISTATTWRGGERQVFNLLNGLDTKGISVSLMSPKNSALTRRLSNANLKQIRFRKGIFSLIINAFSLVRFCRDNNISIVHGHDSHAHTLIWVTHNIFGFKAKAIVTRRLINPIKTRSIAKYNYKGIQKIICISNAVKDVLRPSIKNPLRLITIHSSINIDLQNKINRKLDPKNPFTIGYVAAFTHEKDHHTFIDAAKTLKKKYPQINFKFLLAGDGPLLAEIQEKSKSIKNDINFLGFVEDVSMAYSEMDVILHPCTSEALGTSILDAFKNRLPVVATNIGGIPEIIDHKENGFLCAPQDINCMISHIFELYSNIELRNNIINAAVEKLKQFDHNSMVTKTLNVYEEILKEQ